MIASKLYKILTASLLLAASVSCNKDDLPNGQDIPISLQISKEVGVETRLVSNVEGTELTWENGDIIWMEYFQSNSADAEVKKAKFIYDSTDNLWIAEKYEDGKPLYASEVYSVKSLFSYGGKETNAHDVVSDTYDQSTADKYISYDYLEGSNLSYNNVTGVVKATFSHTYAELVINVTYDYPIRHLANPKMVVRFYETNPNSTSEQDEYITKLITMFPTNIMAEAATPYTGKTVFRAIVKPEYLELYTQPLFSNSIEIASTLYENDMPLATLGFKMPEGYDSQSFAGKRVEVTAQYIGDIRLIVNDVSIYYEVREPEFVVSGPVTIGSYEDLLTYFGPEATLPYKTPMHYTLTKDIDMKDNHWIPSTILSATGHNHIKFVFDGGGHKIYNFAIDGDYPNAGFFTEIGNNITVKNLTLSDFTIQTEGSSSTIAYYAGGLAGALSGEVENCHIVNPYIYAINKAESTNDLMLGGAYAGGLIGSNSSSIKGCSVSGGSVTAMQINTTSISAAGGLVGANFSTLETNRTSGISIISFSAGGVSGVDMNATLTGNLSKDCSITGYASLDGVNFFMGGIAGASFLGTYSTNYWKASDIEYGVGYYVTDPTTYAGSPTSEGAENNPDLTF